MKLAFYVLKTHICFFNEPNIGTIHRMIQFYFFFAKTEKRRENLLLFTILTNFLVCNAVDYSYNKYDTYILCSWILYTV